MGALYPCVLNFSHARVTCTNANNESRDYKLNTIVAAGHPIKKRLKSYLQNKKGTLNRTKKSVKLKNIINKQIINHKMNIVKGIMKLNIESMNIGFDMRTLILKRIKLSLIGIAR